MTKVSVVVPVYNVAPYLAQCLRSIIHNTYKDLEIIIVDDASPDNSAEIYNDFAAKDARIKIIKHAKNKGLSGARNTGLDAATGEYVHFFDSDDFVNLDYYGKMMSAAEMFDGADILSGEVESYNGPHYQQTFRSVSIITEAITKYKCTRAFDNCTVWRHMYRRDFLVRNNIRFAEGRIFEDMLFTPVVFLKANAVVTVPGAIYFYVYNGDSILNKRYTPRHKEQYEYGMEAKRKFAVANGLKALLDYGGKKKEKYRLFGIIPIIAIRWNRTQKSYGAYLFGLNMWPFRLWSKQES
ncbi:MAG: glycosyltransferase [Rickettsiales bacterium]|jgi:glycosyltransferase involved in cell wall biosynthesis|nr:glycosyltransferase [Rickettsiales bacterium]